MPIIFDSAFSQPTIPYHVIEKFNQQDVPPGLTRVTIIHGIDEIRKEIAHGPGVVPSLDKQESFTCDPTLDLCDTISDDGKQWSTLPLDYLVNIKRSGDDGNFLAAVNQGIQTWEDDTDSSFVGSFLGTTNKKSSLADFIPKIDGVNVIDWGRTAHFGGGVIAVVSFLFFTDSGNMVEADMRFNQDLSWCSNGGPIADPDTFLGGDTTCFDVQNIATHEGGHFVAGFNDLFGIHDINLTMFGFATQGEVKKRTLALGDERSIAIAYPAGPNIAPTADAGPDQGVSTSSPVTLDGRGSSDPNGDDLTFSWTQLSGTGVTLVGATTDSPTFTAPAVVSTLIFQLIVNDGEFDSIPDSVTVEVTAPTGGVSVDSIDPAVEMEDFLGLVTITGTGFLPGASVSLINGAGPSPSISNVVVVDDMTITATMTIKDGGPPRDRVFDVQVTNLDLSSDVLIDGFTVRPN